MLKSRRGFSRQWELPYSGHVDSVVTTGHELEAFDNFGVYAHDARTNPHTELVTRDLKLLEPRERHGALLGILEKRSKVEDGRSVMSRLRLTLLCAECFEDLCERGSSSGARRRKQPITISDLPDADQYHFRNAIHEVVRLVNVARHEHPDAIAGGMRAVQICANVGVKLEERRRLMDTLRGYVEEMDEGYRGFRKDDPLNVPTGTDLVSEGRSGPEVRRRFDKPGTRYLYPPQGRLTADELAAAGGDANNVEPIKILPDPKVDSIAAAERRHKEERKNYRYVGDDEENRPLFQRDPKTRMKSEE